MFCTCQNLDKCPENFFGPLPWQQGVLSKKKAILRGYVPSTITVQKMSQIDFLTGATIV